MVVANPYTQYKQVIVNSSSREDLIIMAYDGAIKFLNNSLENFSKKDLEKVNNYILKAHAIISELMISLNFDEGGDIATDLFRIYEYMNYRLNLANMKKDAEPVKEIIELLRILREAWIIAREKVYSNVEYSRK